MTDPAVHPVTGEIIDDPARVAREYARLDQQIHDLSHEVNKLIAARAALEPAVRGCLQVAARLDGGDCGVVEAPPARRPAQRVDPAACQTHAEQLETIGLGEWKRAYAPPRAAEVKAAAAEIIAAGLPLHQILPDPPPPVPEVRVVPKKEPA